MERLFRLRNTESLLGTHQELENQEIFFASPDELNDPLEGFLNIFWQGDRIVWRSFFKYYIYNLSVMTYCAASNEELNLSRKDIDFNVDLRFVPNPILRKFYSDCGNDFVNSALVMELVDYLSRSDKKLFRDELAYVLNSLHVMALKIVFLQASKIFVDPVFGVVGNSPTVDAEIPGRAFLDAVASDQLATIANLHKVNAYESSILILSKVALAERNGNILYLVTGIQFDYIERLIELVYDDVYISCFMMDFPKAPMWGYYADGHKGCCLIFSTEQTNYLDDYIKNSTDRVMQVKRLSGKNWTSMKVSQVKYSNTYPEVCFFSSVGHVVKGIYQDSWLSESGNRSYHYEQRYSNHEAWRDKYYAEAHRLFFQKASTWGGENEARAIIMNFPEQSSVSDRKLMYHFDNLQGIVFGAKTPVSEKYKIMEIIHRKCRENNRDQFKFYQAFFSHVAGEMDMVELVGMNYPAPTNI